MKKLNKTIKDIKPCPLCGSSVEMKLTGKMFLPEEYPYEDVAYPVTEARAFIQCPQCLLTMDLATYIIIENGKVFETAVEHFGKDVEDRWNSRAAEQQRRVQNERNIHQGHGDAYRQS